MQQILEAKHTLGHDTHYNPYHIAILRSRINRNLGAIYANTKDEIVTAFDEILNLEGHGKLRFIVAWLNTLCKPRIIRVEECPYTQNRPTDCQQDYQQSIRWSPSMYVTISIYFSSFILYPLGRDPDWVNLNIEFTLDVVKAAAIISFFPKFMAPQVIIACLF